MLHIICSGSVSMYHLTPTSLKTHRKALFQSTVWSTVGRRCIASHLTSHNHWSTLRILQLARLGETTQKLLCEALYICIRVTAGGVGYHLASIPSSICCNTIWSCMNIFYSSLPLYSPSCLCTIDYQLVYTNSCLLVVSKKSYLVVAPIMFRFADDNFQTFPESAFDAADAAT